MPPIKLKLSLGGAKPSLSIQPIVASNGPRVPASLSRESSPYVDDGSDLSSVESDDDEPVAGPGPATLRLKVMQAASATPSSTSSPVHTPGYTPPLSTPGPGETAPRGRPRGAKTRPSAIPSHLATPSTSYTPSGPFTPLSDVNVKQEHFDEADSPDPLSLPLSPAAAVVTPWDGSVTPAWREGSLDTPGSTTRSGQKWKRARKPFKELANKVLQEMRKKDEYGFFFEPVNLDDYPTYADVIGGEDKMMDLGTMQSKVDDGEYRTMDDLASDLRLMVGNALKFNLPGTPAYREANKLNNVGMKHIDRSRPLVASPSPSPSPSRRRSTQPDSERATPLRSKQKEIPPNSYIPTEMLLFPPDSPQARAVGWNLTGGRRVRAKRFVRGRERFAGKWRDWGPDGSRDVAEMDDPEEVLEELRSKPIPGFEVAPNVNSPWPRVVDWRTLRASGKAWWDWEGLGGPTGQAPLPGQPKIRRDPMPMRTLGRLDYGYFPDVEDDLVAARAQSSESAGASREQADLDLIGNILRPDPPRLPAAAAALPPQTFINVYDSRPAADYLRNMCVGGPRGEAYQASVTRFLKGALHDAAKRRDATSDGDPAVKVDANEPSALEEYVDSWHDGIMRNRFADLSNETALALSSAASGSATRPAAPLDNAALLDAARAAYSRIALRALTSASNPLDLQPLLREQSDFMHVGVGGKSGVKEALDWVANELDRNIAERSKSAKVNGTVNGVAARAGMKRPNGDTDEASNHAKRQKLAADVTGVSETEASKPVVEDDGDVKMEDATQPNGDQESSKADPKPSAEDSKQDAEAAPLANGETKSFDVKSTPPPDDGENGLRSLRLELVALSKFYPLASLRKMSAIDAARLLPANVRALMTRSA